MEKSTAIASILDYWFGTEDELKMRGLWFEGTEAVDTDICERFGELVGRALKGEFDEWKETKEGALALVLLLDQFTRNIHRGTPQAFAGDSRALGLVIEGLAAGIDKEMPTLQRAFFYMPLEHAEDSLAQILAVRLFEDLRKNAEPQLREAMDVFVDYAERHRDIILRFGHFPHRNVILGRATTPEEAAFLEEPGSSF